MNLTEFLEELSKTRNGWSDNAFGYIRKPAGQDDHCPITAVCARVKRVHFSTGIYPLAAERLGLGKNLAFRIAAAADGAEGRLRSRLLKAVGLK